MKLTMEQAKDIMEKNGGSLDLLVVAPRWMREYHMFMTCWNLTMQNSRSGWIPCRNVLTAEIRLKQKLAST